jgi:glycosyltransferase involved in cell wall biosynthesis
MIIVNARFLTQQVTGVQRFAIEISKNLYKLLPGQLLFVTPNNIVNNELAAQLKAKVIGKNKGTAWEQTDLRWYLHRNNNPLLINFTNTGVIFYKNQLVTIHDMSYKVNPKWFSKLFYLWYDYLIPNLVKNSLRVFTVSNSSKNDIVRYLKTAPEKINVIYNSSYLNTNNNFEPIEQEKYILTVSSLDPRKNLNNLIIAFSKINIDVKLIIVGLKSNNFNEGLNTNLLNKNVVLKGYQSDDELGALMKYAEAFVYFSFYEGFGLPSIEAMKMGCPVIVSDIPAHREVCAHAVLYADPHNVDDIGEKITAVLVDDKLKLELKLAGYENVKRFDWFKSAQNVFKVINEVV